MHGQLLFKKAFIPPPIEVGVFCQNYDKKMLDQYTVGNKVQTAKIAEYFGVFVSTAYSRGHSLGLLA